MFLLLCCKHYLRLQILFWTFIFWSSSWPTVYLAHCWLNFLVYYYHFLALAYSLFIEGHNTKFNVLLANHFVIIDTFIILLPINQWILRLHSYFQTQDPVSTILSLSGNVKDLIFLNDRINGINNHRVNNYRIIFFRKVSKCRFQLEKIKFLMVVSTLCQKIRYWLHTPFYLVLLNK